MKLSREEIQKIAKLSRIEIREEEESMFADQLSSVLDYVETLREVSTDDVSITAQVTGLENVYRADEVHGCGVEEKLIAQSPESEDGLIKSKPVF